MARHMAELAATEVLATYLKAAVNPGTALLFGHGVFICWHNISCMPGMRGTSRLIQYERTQGRWMANDATLHAGMAEMQRIH